MFEVPEHAIPALRDLEQAAVDFVASDTKDTREVLVVRQTTFNRLVENEVAGDRARIKDFEEHPAYNSSRALTDVLGQIAGSLKGIESSLVSLVGAVEDGGSALASTSVSTPLASVSPVLCQLIPCRCSSRFSLKRARAAARLNLIRMVMRMMMMMMMMMMIIDWRPHLSSHEASVELP